MSHGFLPLIFPGSHDSEERNPGEVVAQDISSICQRPSSEDISLLKNKKLRDSSSGKLIWTVCER